MKCRKVCHFPTTLTFSPPAENADLQPVILAVDEYEAIPYVILANQFVCVAWFAEYEKYSELYDKNVQMTRWLMDNMEELKKL